MMNSAEVGIKRSTMGRDKVMPTGKIEACFREFPSLAIHVDISRVYSFRILRMDIDVLDITAGKADEDGKSAMRVLLLDANDRMIVHSILPSRWHTPRPTGLWYAIFGGKEQWIEGRTVGQELLRLDPKASVYSALRYVAVIFDHTPYRPEFRDVEVTVYRAPQKHTLLSYMSELQRQAEEEVHLELAAHASGLQQPLVIEVEEQSQNLFMASLAHDPLIVTAGYGSRANALLRFLEEHGQELGISINSK